MNLLKIGDRVKVNNNFSPHFGEYGVVYGMGGGAGCPYEVKFNLGIGTYNKKELLLVVDKFTVPDDALFRLDFDRKMKVSSNPMG